jgi:ABC-type multidrug transport system, ATPase and permease components
MDDTKKREQSLRRMIKTNKLMFSFAWREKKGRLFIFLRIAVALINAAFAVLYAIVPGFVINELLGHRRVDALIVNIALLTLSPVIGHFINKAIRLRLQKLRTETELKFLTDFFDYTLSMDYETLEDPEIQRLRWRAEDALKNVFGFIETAAEFLSSVFSVFAMSSIIVTLNPLMIILVICIVFVNSAVAKKANHRAYLLGKEADKHDDYRDMLRFMMSSFGYAKENRLFNLKSFFIKKFTDNQTEIDKINFKSYKNSFSSSTSGTLTNSVQQIVLYAYLVYNVIAKGLSIGNMTIYMNAVNQLSGALNSAFARYLDLSFNSLSVQDYIEFTSIPPRQRETGDKTPTLGEDCVIEFKNVSYKYPGSENYALRNLNLTIRGKEKLCVVGANGSGKTTFVKLLTRLYFPTEGEILLNGVDINEFDYEKYQQMFSPVFQDFSLYYLSMGENIVLSSEYDKARPDDISADSSLSSLVEKLPKGYDTQVGKAIDPEGFETSGGEGQKIAVARALYHDAPIFLLDEPTAALDPVAEFEIYKQLHEMITDRVVVMITHRLSAVQLADKVAVFENGGLIEYGTHKQLYEQGGIYAEMFDKQAQFYRV